MSVLTLSLLPGAFAVAKLPPDAPAPPPGGPLWSLTRTEAELSLVCEEHRIPDTVRAGGSVAGGWAALMLHGPFPFHLTGVLAAVLDPLRDAGVGIFALSTFDTDYVLVGREHLTRALAALRAAGHTIEDTSEGLHV